MLGQIHIQRWKAASGALLTEQGAEVPEAVLHPSGLLSVIQRRQHGAANLASDPRSSDLPCSPPHPDVEALLTVILSLLNTAGLCSMFIIGLNSSIL